MSWRIAPIGLLLLAASGPARVAEIATYGTGLLPCNTYLAAREEDHPLQVRFINWLSGYLSGANVASPRRNNILGELDMDTALREIAAFCQARPNHPFAVAVGSLAIAAAQQARTHGTETISYGSGLRLCSAYLQAGAADSLDHAEFIDWVGGYVSGFNALSLHTTSILGSRELTAALDGLKQYCAMHPETLLTEATRTFLVPTDAARVAAR